MAENSWEAHEVRITRTENDVQKLFDKFGNAIGLMYKIDKRLEGLYGKIAGVSAATGLLLGFLFVLACKLLKIA